MKFNIKWLQNLVKLNVTPAQLADQLTNSGLEVESLEGDIIEVAVPPNRADCLGMVGIAREAAVLNGVHFVPPSYAATPVTVADKVKVKIENTNACPKYWGRVIKGINNNSVSPQWIQDALTVAGVKIISPVVDITNYVMLEWGQPLHAFDLSKVAEQTIVVRNAKAGEKLLLLDNSTVELTPETLVIADAHNALALAGIKGGLDSGVASTTKDILLECAYFEPVGVRLSARRNAIQTDGSYRFERAIDPTMQLQVMERVTQLILEVVGGKAGEVVSFASAEQLPKPLSVTLRIARISRILGIAVPAAKAVQILQQLGMQTSSNNDTELDVIVPAFRTDISREIDLIEEIARIFGYDNIPAQLPVGLLQFAKNSEAELSEEQVLSCLINRGYHEAITYSFIDSEVAKLFVPTINPALCLSNPIASDMNLMRPSLLPGLIAALQRNLNRQLPRVRLFEIGLRFVAEAANLQQIKTVAGVCTGNYLAENWASPARAVDFYDSKGDVVALFKQAHITAGLEFRTAQDQAMHPGQCVEIFVRNTKVGKLGALHPAITQKLGLESKVYMFELDYSAVTHGQLAKFSLFSKYPSVRRDLALLVDQGLSVASLEQRLRAEAGTLLTEGVVFDVYQGKGIAPGKKSIAIGLTLQHPERTLTEQEVNEVFTRLISMLQQEFNAALR